jgi:hypothetical protein
MKVTQKEISTSFVAGELIFIDGADDAHAAGARLRKAGFGFQIVNHPRRP